MTKQYKKFNLICAILSAFFLFGFFWIWRGEWAETMREKQMNMVVVTEKANLINGDKEIRGMMVNTSTEIENNSLENRNLKLEIMDDVTTSTDELKKEIVKKIPEKINLDVPFTSQAPEKNWGQPWQDACEEVAILMLDAYYKKYNLSPLFAKDEIIKMVEWEETRNFGRSIEIKEIKEIFSDYFNDKSQVIENPTIEQIKQYVAGGNPVLVVADGKVLPNPYFRNGGPVYHALIIRGYTEDSFITNDPGTQFGENFKYKYNDLMNAIHEWNGGDVKNGRKVILVIE